MMVMAPKAVTDPARRDRVLPARRGGRRQRADHAAERAAARGQRTAGRRGRSRSRARCRKSRTSRKRRCRRARGSRRRSRAHRQRCAACSAARAGATSPTSSRRGAVGTMPACELAEVHVALLAAHRAGDRAARAASVQPHAAAPQLPGGVSHGDDEGDAAPPRHHRARRQAGRGARARRRRPARAHGTAGRSGRPSATAACAATMRERARRSRRSRPSSSRCRATCPTSGRSGPGEAINAKGYFVRARQPHDLSVDRHVGDRQGHRADGTVGWGETYGIVAPRAVTAIIDDVLAPMVVGRDPRDAVVIQEDLYDLMRVRGFHGGFYVDAIAGVDIALWDLCAKLAGPAAREAARRPARRPPAGVRVGTAAARRSPSAWRSRANGSARASTRSSTRPRCRTKASSRKCARCARRWARTSS